MNKIWATILLVVGLNCGAQTLSIVTQPTNVVANWGDTVNLSVQAVSSNTIFYQWYRQCTNYKSQWITNTTVTPSATPSSALLVPSAATVSGSSSVTIKRTTNIVNTLVTNATNSSLTFVLTNGLVSAYYVVLNDGSNTLTSQLASVTLPPITNITITVSWSYTNLTNLACFQLMSRTDLASGSWGVETNAGTNTSVTFVYPKTNLVGSGYSPTKFYYLKTYVNCSNVALGWDLETDTNVAGYNLFYGNSAGNYTMVIDVGNTNYYKVTGLTNGMYYFNISAYNAQGIQSVLEPNDLVYTNAPKLSKTQLPLKLAIIQ